MRKYLIGFIAGLICAIAFPAAAAEVTSLVGKTIDAEYPVIVNGKELPVKATSIEGVSSTPNRALADALNLDISFTNNTVIIESKEVGNVGAEETPQKNVPQIIPMDPSEVEKWLESNEQEVTASNFTMEHIESMIRITESSINFAKYNIERLNSPELKDLPETPAELEKLQAHLEKKEAELELWKQRKAELESQLQSQIP